MVPTLLEDKSHITLVQLGKIAKERVQEVGEATAGKVRALVKLHEKTAKTAKKRRTKKEKYRRIKKYR